MEIIIENIKMSDNAQKLFDCGRITTIKYSHNIVEIESVSFPCVKFNASDRKTSFVFRDCGGKLLEFFNGEIIFDKNKFETHIDKWVLQDLDETIQSRL
jgi:hypothetical protein